MSEPLSRTVGIDISKATLDVHVYPAGASRWFANTARGHKALVTWLAQWKIERIAFEAAGTYHQALEQALADLPCVELNPERARCFAQATGALTKTDRLDAALLARMAATLRPPTRPAKSATQVQLAELANARDALIRDCTALKNRRRTLPSLCSSASACSVSIRSLTTSRPSMPRALPSSLPILPSRAGAKS